MRYSWLLLDADGTLFDYDRAEAAALEAALGGFGQTFDSSLLSAYRRINEQVWRDLEQGRIDQERLRTRRFELMFEVVGTDLDPVAFSDAYLLELAQRSDLIEGAAEVVGALCPRVGLMIITNGLAEVQRPRLDRSVIRHCIADIIISEEVGAAKPSAAIFDVAFAKMGWPPKAEVLLVGDSLTSDIKGGNAYGIDVCWYNPRGEPRPADVRVEHEIRRLAELLDIVVAA